MIKRASKYNILNVHYFALLIGTVIGNLSTKCSEYLVRAARAAPACSAARQQQAAQRQQQQQQQATHTTCSRSGQADMQLY